MHELLSPEMNETDWARLQPVLDAALDGLRECDREAVLLRCAVAEGEVSDELRALATKLQDADDR